MGTGGMWMMQQINFLEEEEIVKLIDAEAKLRGSTRTAVIREAIRKHLGLIGD